MYVQRVITHPHLRYSQGGKGKEETSQNRRMEHFRILFRTVN